MKPVSLFGVLAVLILSACNKDVSELPAATQTGANAFGAKVNGEFWVPQGFGVVPTAPILEARYVPASTGRTVVINARNFGKSPTETEFEIYLYNVTGPGTYFLNANTGKYPNQSASYGYYIERRMTPKNEWITTTQHTGRVDITMFDTTNKIISGTFEFNAINMYNDPKPLTVTEGRFDVKVQ
jgi:hypothetical protein